MSLRDARVGKIPQEAKSDDAKSRQQVHEAQMLLESPAWRRAKGELREGYILALQRAPITDDLLRMRLVEAIKIIDMVELHIKKVHSDASFNLDKVIKKDFAAKRGIFR